MFLFEDRRGDGSLEGKVKGFGLCVLRDLFQFFLLY